jgi:hypothetical protein
MKKGHASLFLQLILQRVYTRDEMSTLLDRILNAFLPLYNDDEHTTTLAINRYLPHQELLDLPSVQDREDVIVRVSACYCYSTVYSGVMRAMIDCLCNDDLSIEKLTNTCNDISKMVGSLRNASTIMLPCVAIISGKMLAKLTEWFIESVGCDNLISFLYCYGPMPGEHSLVESTIISLGGKLLKDYPTKWLSPSARDRFNYLVETRVDNV